MLFRIIILWKKKIKSPKIYIRKKFLLLSKIKLFQNKVKNFTVFLTKNKKMKSLNNKFRKKINQLMFFHFHLITRFTKKSYLGDVAVSFEIINKRSNKSNFFWNLIKCGYMDICIYLVIVMEQ